MGTPHDSRRPSACLCTTATTLTVHVWIGGADYAVQLTRREVERALAGMGEMGNESEAFDAGFVPPSDEAETLPATRSLSKDWAANRSA